MTERCSSVSWFDLAASRRRAMPLLSRLAVPTVIAVVVLFLLSIDASEAFARKRHGSGKSSAAAAAARKKQTIQSIQRQVAAAREVLAAAESQAAMSEQQLGAARDRIAEIRKEVEAAESAERQAQQELRDREEDVLANQGPDSPFGNAQTALEDAQRAVDRELHRAVSLPEHAGGFTSAARTADARLLSVKDKDVLQGDVGYQRALSQLERARKNLDQTRRDTLTRDPQWVAFSRALAEASKREGESKQNAKTGPLGSLPAKRSLRTAQDVAAVARLTIAQGEAMLRRLGVKNVAGADNQAKAKKSGQK